MTKQQAVNCLANGHALWTVEYAKEICKTIGLELPKTLIAHYEGQKDANPDNHFKGLWLNEDKPVDGVNALNLSDWVANKLKCEVGSYGGRGFQAQANAEAIEKKLGIKA